MQLGPSESITPPLSEPSVIELPSDADSANPATLSDAGTTQQARPTAIEGLISRFNSPNTLFIFGIFLMVILMMRMVRKNHKANAKRSNAQFSPSKRIAAIHDQAQSTMDPAYRVMVDAEEMARRLGATLDNKAARLELLIEEADRKLAVLNRSLANQSAPSPSQETQAPAPMPSATQANPTRTIDPSLLDRARMEQDLEERQTRVAGRIEPTPQEAPPTPAPIPEEPQSIQSQIIELAAAGCSNIEIAHQLKQPIGQVELILNLRKQQG